LLKDLRSEGFYVQMMNIDEGLSQARKDDIVLAIVEEGSSVNIETARDDAPFVKTAMYEAIVGLHDSLGKLKDSSDPREMKKDLMDGDGRTGGDMLSLITPECISINLKAAAKEEIITELVEILAARGRLLDRDTVLNDVLEREKVMSTGMEHGIALPHAKSDGVDDIIVAVGIKKEGLDFESIDGKKSRLFILVVSPKKATVPHVQFLAAIGAVLVDDATREAVINAASPETAAKLLQTRNAAK
jgi:fructose-specific phosphotransferase system IIA component